MLPERTGQQLKSETKNHEQLLSTAQLEELVLAAQKGEQVAIDAMCTNFKPLVMQEAHRSYVAQALGEEAENTAWVYFLEFIMSYKDNCYQLLPVLIKMKLRFAFMQKIYRKKHVATQFLLDATNEDGRRLYEPSMEDKNIEKILFNVGLTYALKCLTAKQRHIVEATVMGEMSLTDYSQKHGLSYTAAYLLQKRALSILKKAF